MTVIFEKNRTSLYDDFIKTWMPGYTAFIQFLAYLLDTKNDGIKEILIVGCGTGNELISLNKKKPNWKLTGIDPSSSMLEIAEEKTEHLENITLINSLLEDISPDKNYDALLLTLVLHFIPNDGQKLQLLKEAALRLKQGGVILICDVFGSKRELDKNLQILRQHLLYNNITDIEERFVKIREDFHYIKENELCQLLVDAGFQEPIRYYQSTIYGAWISYKK